MHLIRTKLHRPGVPADIVCRGRLHALMDRSLEKPVTLVSAPAGYGKSVLVSHWADTIEHPVAWISLDQSDSDLTQYLDYLAAALDEALPGACRELKDVVGAGQLPPIENLAGRLINELARLDRRFVLCLDDYHRIEPTSKVHELLSLLLEHPLRHLHLVLIGRRDPPLPVWRLRAASMVNEVRLRDLCFLDEEVTAFLAKNAPTAIGAEAIRRLQGEVEGWAAGLRLASLAMRQIQDPDRLLVHLKGGVQQAQDYLLHEVLAQQPSDFRRCLLRSSIFRRFCPALIEEVCLPEIPPANAVTGGEIVDSLLRSELFTVGLDSVGEWFRFHHLFQELLRAEFARTSTDREVADLHLRASVWFETQNLISESIEHALAAQDRTRAAELVERHAQTEFSADRWYVIERWLAMLPIEIRRGRPNLLLIEAFVRNLQHQLVRVPPLIDEAEALLASGGSAAKPDTASSQHWVLAMDAEPKPHNLFCWLEVPQLTAARVLIGKGAPAPLGRALELLAAVRKLGAESRFRCQLIEVAVLEAVALERQGKPDGAAAALDEALALARPGGWLRPFLESGAPLRGHLARLGKKGTEDGFLDVILRRLGPEGPNATRQPQTAANTSEPPVRIDSPHIELLSNREHDIIELLADRLRSKEIADRLFISTHTVNAHLKRIYRKLGVSNRREAVERAVRARLIERR